MVSVATAVITLLFAFPATYALTRLKLWGSKAILGALMSIYLFPVMLFVAPLYVKAVQFGLIDTYIGLIIPYVAFSLPFSIWLLKGFLEGIPVEIEEAAHLDGCTPWQLFAHIVIPLMRPGIFAVMLMVFILAWTEFLTPLLFTRDIKILTVQLGLYRSTFDIKIGQMAAAAVLTALPVVLLTAFFQRIITQAITAVVDK
ncbi:MAG: carbohydrate ABC transporter permease, partial [Limnochordales bacterium]